FPDLETRMAILAAKAEALRVTLPQEVIEFVAQEVQSNIRELEGALTRVLALARTMGYSFTVQTAQRALGGLQRPAANVTVEHILAQVGAYYSIDVEELVGKRRTRDVAIARQVAMYLTRDLTEMSLPQIGEAIGGRDHTTVMHGVNKVTALFEKDDNMRRQVLEIKNQLYSSAQRAPALENASHA
ncbi:MAG: chromosomal replication initiator protein DnaA, partial [Chloroflexi bacterium]|nr:chromosomal replication initiator protein DnaA [Chloroflexota bacterium]